MIFHTLSSSRRVSQKDGIGPTTFSEPLRTNITLGTGPRGAFQKHAPGCLTSLFRRLPSLWERSEHAKLLHDRVEVRDAPMLDDPSIDDTHCVNRLEAHLPASSRNAEEVPEMGAVIGFIGGDDITVGLLPMNLRSEVG